MIQAVLCNITLCRSASSQHNVNADFNIYNIQYVFCSMIAQHEWQCLHVSQEMVSCFVGQAQLYGPQFGSNLAEGLIQCNRSRQQARGASGLAAGQHNVGEFCTSVAPSGHSSEY